MNRRRPWSLSSSPSWLMLPLTIPVMPIADVWVYLLPIDPGRWVAQGAGATWEGGHICCNLFSRPLWRHQWSLWPLPVLLGSKLLDLVWLSLFLAFRTIIGLVVSGATIGHVGGKLFNNGRIHCRYQHNARRARQKILGWWARHLGWGLWLAQHSVVCWAMLALCSFHGIGWIVSGQLPLRIFCFTWIIKAWKQAHLWMEARQPIRHIKTTLVQDCGRPFIIHLFIYPCMPLPKQFGVCTPLKSSIGKPKDIGISLAALELPQPLFKWIDPINHTKAWGNSANVYFGLALYAIGFVLFAFATQGWMMYVFTFVYCLGGIWTGHGGYYGGHRSANAQKVSYRAASPVWWA